MISLPLAIRNNNLIEVERLARETKLNAYFPRERRAAPPQNPFNTLFPWIPFPASPKNRPIFEKISPLTLAVLESNPDTVKLLLELGADPNAFDGQAVRYVGHPKTQNKLEKLLILFNGGASLKHLANSKTFASSTNLGFNLAGAENEREMWEGITTFAQRSGKEMPDAFVAGFLAGLTYWGKLPLLKQIGEERGNFIKGTIDDWGNTLLHYAALSPRLAKETQLLENIVDYLLNAGLNIDVGNRQRVTPLHVLSTHAHADAIRLFLSRGANANARDEEGNTPIVFALIEQGRKIKPTTKSFTQAVKRCVGVLETLIEGGGNPNLIDGSGFVPLYWYITGVDYLFPEIVEALFRGGADPNLKTRQMLDPLLIELLHRTPREWEVIRSFLENGADPLDVDTDGDSFFTNVFIRAEEEEISDEKVRSILKLAAEKASTLSKPERGGYSPLHNAARSSSDLFELYLPLVGASDLNAPTLHGKKTVLHLIASTGNIKRMMATIERGANLSLKDADGETPLDLLLREGLFSAYMRFENRGGQDPFEATKEFLKTLRKRGIDFSKPREEVVGAPLHAISKGLMYATNYLNLKVEALIRTKDPGDDVGVINEVESLFQYMGKIADLMKVLVQEFGVPINAKDDRGWTPLHYLSETQNRWLIRIAIELGAKSWIITPNGEAPGDLLLEKNGEELPRWAVDLGLFPIKNANILAQQIEVAEPTTREKIIGFLNALLKDEPLLAIELLPQLASKSQIVSRLVQEAINTSLDLATRTTPSSNVDLL